MKKLKLPYGLKEGKLADKGERPADIPSNPQRTYKKNWQGWKHWLGTDKKD